MTPCWWETLTWVTELVSVTIVGVYWSVVSGTHDSVWHCGNGSSLVTTCCCKYFIAHLISSDNHQHKLYLSSSIVRESRQHWVSYSPPVSSLLSSIAWWIEEFSKKWPKCSINFFCPIGDKNLIFLPLFISILAPIYQSLSAHIWLKNFLCFPTNSHPEEKWYTTAPVSLPLNLLMEMKEQPNGQCPNFMTDSFFFAHFLSNWYCLWDQKVSKYINIKEGLVHLHHSWLIKTKDCHTFSLL